MQLGNFTGIPGLVVPVGYSTDGLPITLQVSYWLFVHAGCKTPSGFVLNHYKQVPAVAYHILEELAGTGTKVLTCR